MLANFNQHIKGWVAWFIAIIIAFTFVLFGAQSYISSHAQLPPAATVNGIEISESAVRDQYQRLIKQQLAESNGQLQITPELEKQLKLQAKEQLITSTVLSQAGANLGLVISQNQAEQELVGIPAFQEDGQFSEEKFHAVMSSAAYAPQAFIQDLANSLLMNQLSAGFVASAFVLPSDVDSAVSLLQQKRDFRYLIIDKDQFKKGTEPSLEAQKTFYTKNIKQFMTPEKVQLEYLILSMKALAERESVTDEQLKNYYERNKASYQTSARWKIAHILIKDKSKLTDIESQIKQQPFERLAKKYSDDVMSASKGGELPWLTQKSLPKSLAATITQMQSKGEINGPIDTDKGFEFIKLLDYTPPKVQSFESLKVELKQRYINERIQKVFADASERLANLTYQNPDSLTDAAKTLKLKLKTTDWLRKSDNIPGYKNSQKVVREAFKPDIIELGNNSDVLALNDDSVIVIRVSGHQIPKAKSFDAVAVTIKQQLLAISQREHAAKTGAQLLAKLKKNESIQKQLKQLNLKWQTVRSASRFKSNAPTPALSAAFRLNINNYNGQQVANGNYLIIQLQVIAPGDPKALSNEQRGLYLTQIENTFGMLDYQLYVNSLIQKANIERS